MGKDEQAKQRDDSEKEVIEVEFDESTLIEEADDIVDMMDVAASLEVLGFIALADSLKNYLDYLSGTEETEDVIQETIFGTDDDLDEVVAVLYDGGYVAEARVFERWLADNRIEEIADEELADQGTPVPPLLPMAARKSLNRRSDMSDKTQVTKADDALIQKLRQLESVLADLIDWHIQGLSREDVISVLEVSVLGQVDDLLQETGGNMMMEEPQLEDDMPPPEGEGEDEFEDDFAEFEDEDEEGRQTETSARRPVSSRRQVRRRASMRARSRKARRRVVRKMDTASNVWIDALVDDDYEAEADDLEQVGDLVSNITPADWDDNELASLEDWVTDMRSSGEGLSNAIYDATADEVGEEEADAFDTWRNEAVELIEAELKRRGWD